MRIALTHPWCWPQVQRGGERLFDDLARWLSGAGHSVTTVSTVVGPGGRRRQGNRLAVEHRAVAPRILGRYDLDEAVTYLPATAASLLRAKPDVVHGLSYLDGVAARLARRSPCVVHLQGMPQRASLANRPAHRRLFTRSVAAADALVTVSQAAADMLQAEFGLHARAIHNGVDVATFAAATQSNRRNDRPTVLFPGAVDDPRKRLPALVEAIRALASTWPGLTLAVGARTELAAQRDMRERLGDAVQFLEVAGPDAMPAAYAWAWVTCLPAVREAFGLVFVESLAAGTPAVGLRDGGVPEVIGVPSWLAEPDDVDSLAEALDQALRDVQAPGAVLRCQSLAAPFDWSVRGPRFEALYQELLGA